MDPICRAVLSCAWRDVIRRPTGHLTDFITNDPVEEIPSWTVVNFSKQPQPPQQPPSR